jgi:trehalose 6-phosphate synthase
VTWIASALTDEDRVVARERGDEAFEETARDGSPYRLRLVDHDEQAYDWFYNVVANPTLWFAQHYLWNLGYGPEWDYALHNAWENGYCVVNRGFADAVVAELDRVPDSGVLFHDYHLYLAPAMVREQRPGAALAHFVHIPWPQSDYWYVLPHPMRVAIHEGLLGNDVVGFHAWRWQRSFLRGAREHAGVRYEAAEGWAEMGDRRVQAVVHPISVDPGEFEELAGSPAVLGEEQALAARRPEFVVLRVDRTDPSKNVLRGFRAFELYLDAHHEMHRRVGMVALLDPSRQDIPEYAEYLGAIQREARRVNDRFQLEGWTPIDLQIADNFAQSVAAYKQYDVLLVNAIFDGLNLVAKEGPLVNERDGVLLLSENAGAFEELGRWALPVNPFDVAQQAEAIHRALEMAPAERRARADAIREHVREHDLAAWVEAFLADLDRVASPAPR